MPHEKLACAGRAPSRISGQWLRLWMYCFTSRRIFASVPHDKERKRGIKQWRQANTGFPVLDTTIGEASLLFPASQGASLDDFLCEIFGYWSGCHIMLEGLECGESSGRFPAKELKQNDNSHTFG